MTTTRAVRARSRALVLAAMVAGVARPLAAQVVPGEGALIGTVAADRDRLRQLTGTPDSTAAVGHPEGWRFRATPAVMRTVWNSGLPYSINEGPMWAGRGRSMKVTAGVAVEYLCDCGTFSVVVAPTYVHSENRPFDFFVGRDPRRSGYSSPWHIGDNSMDLPLRMGNEPLTVLYPGETSVTWTRSLVGVGFASGSEWWGPAIRNTLLLSNNAPGVPRLFIRSGAPVRTRVGQFEWRLFGGALSESRFFDVNGTNDHQSLSGLLLMYRPIADTGLTLGFARTVTRPVRYGMRSGERIFDALTRWKTSERDSATGATTYTADQMAELFFRWVFPRARFEFYGEWARLDPPRSLFEALVATHYTQGYTLGLQWAVPTPMPAAPVRIQLETTDLEQSPAFDDRPLPSFYVGRATEHGFTNHGQVLGAAIGPGGTAQWLAVDFMPRRWQAGLFAGRTRWENDVLFDQVGTNFFRHDVTVFWGVRGAATTRVLDVAGDITAGKRMNYLFQNGFANPGGYRTVDVRNTTLTFTLSRR